jgi:hypothetical protein
MTKDDEATDEYKLDDKLTSAVSHEAQIQGLNHRLFALETIVAMILAASTRSDEARAAILNTLAQFPHGIENAAFPVRAAGRAEVTGAEQRDAVQSLCDFLIHYLRARTA